MSRLTKLSTAESGQLAGAAAIKRNTPTQTVKILVGAVVNKAMSQVIHIYRRLTDRLSLGSA